jgi:hypothetical protein
MQRLPQGAKVVEENRLIKVWRLENGDCRAQGKRVDADNPLTLEERRYYVSILGRSAQMVKFLMEQRQISLSEAWELLKRAR